MSKVNRRRNPRVPCGARAKAEGPRGPMNGKCRNISIGGFFFQGNPLPVGTTAEFSIELAEGTVQAQGEVRYHANFPDGAGMGIRFTRLSQEHMALIGRFVDANKAGATEFE